MRVPRPEAGRMAVIRGMVFGESFLREILCALQTLKVYRKGGGDAKRVPCI